jgi:hypothetical protein
VLAQERTGRTFDGLGSLCLWGLPSRRWAIAGSRHKKRHQKESPKCKKENGWVCIVLSRILKLQTNVEQRSWREDDVVVRELEGHDGTWFLRGDAALRWFFFRVGLFARCSCLGPIKEGTIVRRGKATDMDSGNKSQRALLGDNISMKACDQKVMVSLWDSLDRLPGSVYSVLVGFILSCR